ncbi:hypothetical protein [Ensifer adhaerens]|jgi:type VI secretion system protein VasI|uniref:hypothetical protein n=1 Tax=Ensifer adhaerens TaxID=106592 RepID=UPI00202ED64E|nr:hypothetical protein [Ensifer adhaerens]
MQSRIVLAASMLVVLAGASKASECALVDNDLDRLACFDRESGREKSVSVSAAKGKWQLREEISKLTDQKEVFLMVSSNDRAGCGWNKDGHADLLLMCRDKTTSLVINTGCHMASNFGTYGDVNYRIGKNKAKTVAMDASSDNKSLGLWSGGQSIPVIKVTLPR